tara:strand:+ start:130 stop:417 length:288 start_codon:yes stop_codon:yes gene_type:complete
MSAPIINLRADVIGCIKRYKSALLNNPQKSAYVFNTKTDSKSDARYAFTTELKGLAELCVLCRDAETLAIIKMSVNPEEDQMAADNQAISQMKIE